jgi:SPP1 gp7 family putative phage head morphogenesis protein
MKTPHATLKRLKAVASLPRETNPLRYDPSRTGGLRTALGAHVNRQFAELGKRVRELVVTQDAFGLAGPNPHPLAVNLTANGQYASTQFDVTNPEVVAGIAAVKARIDPADITEDEDTPHVTVRYGLHDAPDLARRVDTLLASSGPVFARLGRLSLFQSPGKPDVLKFDIEGQQLHDLYGRLSVLPNTTTHPQYRPHMTVAYLKEGTGHKYLDLTPARFVGGTLTFTKLVVSGKDRDRQVVTLNRRPHPLANVFCATGQGGGVDPTCSPSSVLSELAIKYGIPAHEITTGTHSGNGVRGFATRGARSETDKAGAEEAKAKGLKAHPLDRTGSKFMVMSPGSHVSFHRDIETRPPNPDSYKGRFTATRATAVHEFGHILQYRAGIDEKEAHRLLTPEEKVVARSVSRYAATNYAEMLSELFVRYESDGTHHPYLDRILPKTTNAAWDPGAPREQVKAFRDWLRLQSRELVTSQGQEAMWDRFTETAYKQGVGRTVDEAPKKVVPGTPPKPPAGPVPTKQLDQYVRARTVIGMIRPDTVKAIKGQAFDSVKGMSEDMLTRLSRVVSDGVTRGLNPRTIASRLAKELEISRTRAQTIVATELTRAHAEGQLDAMESLGVKGVLTNVEWVTAGKNVCPRCARFSGKVFTVKAARGLIPHHPRCKCSFSSASGKKATGRRPKVVENAFCPTGSGGGVDPHCSPGTAGAVTTHDGVEITSRSGESPNVVAAKAGLGSADQVARAVGAQPGFRVKVHPTPEGDGVFVSMTDPATGLKAYRTLSREGAGVWVCTNDSMVIPPEHQGKGLGSTVFRAQVAALRQQGFARIETVAERNAAAHSDMKANGYYTWARMGYDAPIPKGVLPHLAAHPDPVVRTATRVSDLMTTEAGRLAWFKHGDSLHMVFDLADGSRSMQVHTAYLEERAKRPTTNADFPDLDALDEAALDAAWARMAFVMNAVDWTRALTDLRDFSPGK